MRCAVEATAIRAEPSDDAEQVTQALLLEPLEAIGHELDLTRERVRQLEGQALSRLAALRELVGLAA